MAKKIQLTIAEPCHEGWDNMTPVEKGRFCGSCQKQVVDFSNMSDRQVAEFFKKPSTGSVCGRFMTDQLDRAIDIPKKRIPWVKYFFQIALPAFLVSIKVSARSSNGKIKTAIVASDTTKPVYHTMGMVARPQPKKDTAVIPPVCKDPVMGKVSFPYEIIKAGIGNIKGIVTNEQGDPLPGATILIKGTRTAVAADADGKFNLIPKTVMDKAVLQVSYVGFELLEMNIDKNTPDPLVLKLKFRQDFVEGFVICAKPPVKKEIKNVPLMPVKNDARSAFKIFPNPVSPGTNLSIEWKKIKDGDYTLDIIDQSGASLYRQNIQVSAETKLMNLEMPSVAAGSYFLVLINKKAGKKYSEKIIVQ